MHIMVDTGAEYPVVTRLFGLPARRKATIVGALRVPTRQASVSLPAASWEDVPGNMKSYITGTPARKRPVIETKGTDYPLC